MPKKPPKPVGKPTPVRPPAAQRTKTGAPRSGKPARYPDATRVAEVQRLMTMRYSDAEIIRRVSAPPSHDEAGTNVGGFGVSERTVRADITRVMADWLEASNVDRDRKVASARATAEAMFRRHLARNEGKLADSYFDKLCKIDGAYAPDQMKLLGADVAGAASLSDEELDAALAEEARRILAAFPPERRAAILRAASHEDK